MAEFFRNERIANLHLKDKLYKTNDKKTNIKKRGINKAEYFKGKSVELVYKGEKFNMSYDLDSKRKDINLRFGADNNSTNNLRDTAAKYANPTANNATNYTAYRAGLLGRSYWLLPTRSPNKKDRVNAIKSRRKAYRDGLLARLVALHSDSHVDENQDMHILKYNFNVLRGYEAGDYPASDIFEIPTIPGQGLASSQQTYQDKVAIYTASHDLLSKHIRRTRGILQDGALQSGIGSGNGGVFPRLLNIAHLSRYDSQEDMKYNVEVSQKDKKNDKSEPAVVDGGELVNRLNVGQIDKLSDVMSSMFDKLNNQEELSLGTSNAMSRNIGKLQAILDKFKDLQQKTSNKPDMEEEEQT